MSVIYFWSAMLATVAAALIYGLCKEVKTPLDWTAIVLAVIVLIVFLPGLVHCIIQERKFRSGRRRATRA
jgi:uncharacterized membrane protein YkvI